MNEISLDVLSLKIARLFIKVFEPRHQRLQTFMCSDGDDCDLYTNDYHVDNNNDHDDDINDDLNDDMMALMTGC